MDAPHEVGLAVSEEKIFEIVNDDGRTDGRTTDAGVRELTCESSASGLD